MSIRVAFISGPMYDPLYARIAEFTRTTGINVEIAFQGDHPALNSYLAQWVARPEEVPVDLVSTHTKYFPAQKPLLAPLDAVLPPDALSDFAPLLLKMVRLDGQVYCLPRNIDVRLLHYRTDIIEQIPATWDELLQTIRRVNQPPGQYGFVFPGMESGLFGTFYEMSEMGGAQVFPANLVPQVENDGGFWALNFLRTCYQEGLVPQEIVGWHYDKVHDFFREGRAALVGDWPGYYGDYRDPAVSPIAERFALARYPKGPVGRSYVYGGGHTFALTHKGTQSPQAAALLQFLTAPEQQMLEASHGSVPVRQSVMRQVQAGASPAEKARWRILADVIEEDVIIPPKFASYPRVEEVLWVTVQSAITGKLSIEEALYTMTRQIQEIIEESHEQ
jgi:multiple sugar transport system substrate-binding protein